MLVGVRFLGLSLLVMLLIISWRVRWVLIPSGNLLSGSFLKEEEDREPLRRSLPEHPVSGLMAVG